MKWKFSYTLFLILIGILNGGIILLCILKLEDLNIMQGLTYFSPRVGKSETIDSNLGMHLDYFVRQIDYGSPLKQGVRAPLVMIQKKLASNVLSRFLEVPMFSCDENELNNFSGLENRVKVPIYIYEGYFHSLITNENIYSRNPNPQIAIDFMKPAANDFIRKFYESFRIINSNIFDKLKEDLKENAIQRRPNDPENDICYGFAMWIEKGYLFGDLSIQIHYGRGNEATFPRAWHTDAENSLLHLALTLKGSRVLHTRRGNSSIGLIEEKLNLQSPGDVYLSSSTLMLHAPKFSDTNYENRVVAIHARILYTSEELQQFRQMHTMIGWENLVNIIANNLASADLKIPTINQIESTNVKSIK